MHIGEILVLSFLAFVIVGVAAYVISMYNGMIALKKDCARSWANIDVLLKQRHDELPKLIKTCEGYMQHERAVFDKLSEARGAVTKARSVGERAQAEGLVTRALGQFFAVAEAYPDLKANQSFLQLQSRITQIENQIADRREFYNDVVTTLNTRLEQFPTMYVAQWIGMKGEELFEVSDDDRRDVEVRFAMAG